MQAPLRPAAGPSFAKRIASALGLAILATLALAPAAHAQPSLLDSLLSSCHPDDIECTVKTAVEESVSTVNETAEPVVRRVEETVTTVENLVEETVTSLLPQQTPPAPAGNPGPGADNAPQTDPDQGPNVQRVRRQLDPATTRAAIPNALSAKAVQDLRHSSAQSVAGTTVQPTDRDPGFNARELSSKLAFPALLTLLLGMFLIVQSRFDRKEAKLVLAPLQAEEELLNFQ